MGRLVGKPTIFFFFNVNVNMTVNFFFSKNSKKNQTMERARECLESNCPKQALRILKKIHIFENEDEKADMLYVSGLQPIYIVHFFLPIRYRRFTFLSHCRFFFSYTSIPAYTHMHTRTHRQYALYV